MTAFKGLGSVFGLSVGLSDALGSILSLELSGSLFREQVCPFITSQKPYLP